MSRGISSELLAASTTAQHMDFLIFAKLEFDNGTITVHDGIGEYTFGGDTYQGVGAFGSISAIEEGEEISPYEINLILSGLDATLIDEAMNQDYYQRLVTIYIGALDTSMALDGTPDEVWSGKMDVMDVNLGEDNGIQLTCESELARFEKSNGARYSDADLQAETPGDLMAQFMDQMVDLVVVWRGKKTSSGSAGGGRRPGGPQSVLR